VGVLPIAYRGHGRKLLKFVGDEDDGLRGLDFLVTTDPKPRLERRLVGCDLGPILCR
jgi:hypothetical protein